MNRENGQSTPNALKQAFLELYDQKDINRIFVTEITERSGYSRNTFYLYFHNPYDLLESLKNDVLQTTSKGLSCALSAALLGHRAQGADAEAISQLLACRSALLILLRRDPVFGNTIFDATEALISERHPVAAALPRDGIRLVLTGLLFLSLQKLANNEVGDILFTAPAQLFSALRSMPGHV